MPRKRKVNVTRRRRLTPNQRRELLIGPPGFSWHSVFPNHPARRAPKFRAPWAFASELRRREAWDEHRDELMARGNRVGRRPWGWWRYSAPQWPLTAVREEYLPVPLTDHWELQAVDESQTECLDRLGLLSDQECLLLTQWDRRTEAA